MEKKIYITEEERAYAKWILFCLQILFFKK